MDNDHGRWNNGDIFVGDIGKVVFEAVAGVVRKKLKLSKMMS
jgi:hypothetical protein